MKKILFLVLICSIHTFSQEKSTMSNSVGLSLKSLQSEGIGAALNIEGSYFNIADDWRPLSRYMTYIDYAADIGVISVGNEHKKSYIDIDVKIDGAYSWLYLPLILPQPTARYFQDDSLRGYEWGLGTGVGLNIGTKKDPKTFIASAHILSGELEKAQIFSELNNGTEITYDYYKQNADIFEKESLSKEALLAKYPERFSTSTETKKIDLTDELKSISGFKLKLKTSLLPLKGGKVLIGTEFRSLNAVSKNDNPIEDLINKRKVPYTEMVDGVEIEKEGYLYSDSVIANSFDQHEIKYSKIEYSLDLGYQKGKIRIWLSRNYRLQELKNVVTDIKKSNKRISHTLKFGYKF